MRFLYNDQWVPGLYIILDLRRFGLKNPAILAYLQRMERRAQKVALLEMQVQKDASTASGASDKLTPRWQTRNRPQS